MTPYNYNPYNSGFSSYNQGELYQNRYREYLKSQLLQQALIQKAQQDERGDNTPSVVGGVAGLDLAKELGTSIFGSGSGSGAVPSIPKLISAKTVDAAPTIMGSEALSSGLSIAGPAIAAAMIAPPTISGVKNLASGKKLDWKEKAALALPTFGLSLLPWGHSKRYYEGEDRKKFAKKINQQFGSNVLDVEKFDNDQGSWSYDLNSMGKNRELGGGQALAYLLGAGPLGSKMTSDLTSRFANDIKNGKSVSDLYSAYKLNKDTAMQRLGADTNLSAQDRAALQNGLNDAFAPAPSGQAPVAQNGLGQTGTNPVNSNWPNKPQSIGWKMKSGKTYMGPGVYR